MERNIITDQEFTCPVCKGRTTLIVPGCDPHYSGPKVMGHHKGKVYISETQYILYDCPTGGNEIVEGPKRECPVGSDCKACAYELNQP
jgi:hypothetical protein